MHRQQTIKPTISFGKKKGIPDDNTAKDDITDTVTGEANDAEPENLVDEAAISKMVGDAEIDSSN